MSVEIQATQLKVRAADVKEFLLERTGQTSLFLNHTTTIRCNIKLFMTGSRNGLLESLIQHLRNPERLLVNLTDQMLSDKYIKLDANNILMI